MNLRHLERSVLVVDDDRFVLRTAAVLLKRMGYAHVLTAENAEAALGSITSTASPPVGLVLSDLNMPDVDGVELLRRFDELGYRGDIILCSGEDEQMLSMAVNLARARNLSVLGSITKPIRFETLSVLLANDPKTEVPSKRGTWQSVTAEMLEGAIETGELEPWFQPKIDIARKEPVGVEALARWPNSAWGPIFPDAFIPVAEEYGLIDRLTFQLVEKTVLLRDEWRTQGVDLKIAVNISMDSLHNLDFPSLLEDALKGISSVDGFELEVTESRLMENLVRPLDVLLRLRLKRITLSIDDFGTGYSNLIQLRDLPFDEIKLDRSYVQGAVGAGRSKAILESSVEMAKKLGMVIVAEGVETLEDWNRMEQLGCDQVQGYFVARPMPGDQVVDWVTNWPQQRKRLFR